MVAFNGVDCFCARLCQIHQRDAVVVRDTAVRGGFAVEAAILVIPLGICRINDAYCQCRRFLCSLAFIPAEGVTVRRVDVRILEQLYLSILGSILSVGCAEREIIEIRTVPKVGVAEGVLLAGGRIGRGCLSGRCDIVGGFQDVGEFDKCTAFDFAIGIDLAFTVFGDVPDGDDGRTFWALWGDPVSLIVILIHFGKLETVGVRRAQTRFEFIAESKVDAEFRRCTSQVEGVCLTCLAVCKILLLR